MYQISRQLADEDTGIPSILHGQTGVTGTGRTASRSVNVDGISRISYENSYKEHR